VFKVGETIQIKKTKNERMEITGLDIDSMDAESLEELTDMISTLYWYLSFKKSRLKEME
jgi:hypothetical protein